MAGSEKLSAIAVQQLAKKPGMHGDGKGLYLRVSNPRARSWAFRYMQNRKAHEVGLGPYPEVSLAEARRRAADARQLLAYGKDPLAEKASAKAAQAAEAAKSVTFKDAAERYIEAHKAGWKNAKHAAQWQATFNPTRRGKTSFAAATAAINDLPVGAIDTDLVLKVLEPIWTTKTETAKRIRGRIESVLDWARVRGYRDGENPARWRGHLDQLLAAPSKVQRVQHHAALPYAELPQFMGGLREQDGISARALEFAILTAARTGEVLGAFWSEIDLKEKVWTVPAERMKAGKEHRVPLSARAIEILKEMKALGSEGFVFSGSRGKPLSNMALLMLLRRMGRGDLTAHGFRSTFRDWAAERTNFPAEVAEMALAHSVGDKVEAAYRRGDLFAKRRELMDAWGSSSDRV